MLLKLVLLFFNVNFQLLLVCKNTIDFYILILYPATFLNSFISFKNKGVGVVCVRVDSLGFSLQIRSCHLKIKIKLSSLFPICMPFISFS